MTDTDGSTVFVLGAGFTRAFLPHAPLLVDDYGGEALLRQFQAFPYAAALIALEMKQLDHRPGLINLERLMTRLICEMPHDHGTDSRHVFALIVKELMQSFRRRLSQAKADGLQSVGELRLFAGHCIRTKSTCISFNYDDVLDEALWTFNPEHVKFNAWSPDWGYGFPCRMSQVCVSEAPAALPDSEAMLLLKLHGSINWRIPLGSPKPYVIEAVRHHESWFEHYGHNHEKVPVDKLEPYLESEPMMIPPVLTKAELNEQPVLRVAWEKAINALEHADRVVFLGYSLPITDIAVCFLLREGLDHLSAEAVRVIDFAQSSEDRQAKRDQLLRSYKNVLPSITEEQIEFCGAIDWIRNNLANWFYDSTGQPIAFEVFGRFVTWDGAYIGSRCRMTEVWNVTYKGEIVQGDRLLYRVAPPTEHPGGDESPPPLPLPGTLPRRIHSIPLPEGYRDIGDSV